MLTAGCVLSVAGVFFFRAQVRRAVDALLEKNKVLADLENRYSTLLSAVPDIIMEVDSNHVYTWANEAGREFFGTDVVGKTAAAFFEGIQQAYQAVNPPQQGKESVIYIESWQRRKDGAKRLLAWWCRSLIDEKGRPRGTLSSARDITEQRDIEESLRRSEEKFLKAFDSSPLLMAISEIESGRYLEVNGTFLNVTGYSRDEVIGRPSVELGLFKDPAERTLLVEQFKKYRHLKDAAVKINRKDGSVLHGLFSAEQMNIGGKPYMLTLMHDVTELHTATKALRESEENLSVTLASIGDAVIATDRGGNVTLMNPVASALTGWTFAHAEGKPLDEVFNVINETTRMPVENPVKKVLRDGVVIGLANHTVLVSRDGIERPIADSGAPIRGADGIIRGVVLVFRDVSEEYEQERRLRESETRFHSLFENMNEGVALHDVVFGDDGKPVNYRIVDINARYQEHTGISRAAAVGKLATEAYGENVPPYLEEFCRPALTGEPYFFETFYPTMGKHFSISVAPWGTNGFATIFQDITERKSAEAGMKRALAEKEVLLREIHHRVKNNMQIISSLLDRERRKFPDGPARNVFDESRRRISVMSMVHELLYRSDDISSVDLGDFARQLTSYLINAYSGESRNVMMRCSAGEVNISIDKAIPAGLVINELVSNACKHAFPERSGAITIDVRRDDETVVITISDDGKGIAGNWRDHVGSGLTLVLGLVEQLRGTMTVDSAPGVRAVIRFPRNNP